MIIHGKLCISYARMIPYFYDVIATFFFISFFMHRFLLQSFRDTILLWLRSCFLLLQICDFIWFLWYRYCFSFPNSTFAIGLTTVIVIVCLHCNHLFQPFLCFITFLVLLLFFATFLQLWSIHLWLNRSLDTKAIVYFIVCHSLCFTILSVLFWFCSFSIALIGCFAIYLRPGKGSNCLFCRSVLYFDRFVWFEFFVLPYLVFISFVLFGQRCCYPSEAE